MGYFSIKTSKQPKRRNVLTLVKTALSQYIFFPLAFNLLAPVFLLILVAVSFSGAEPNLIALLVMYFITAFFSALGGFLFGIRFKINNGFNPVCFILILLTPLALNTLIFAISGVIGETATVIANITVNPLFIIITYFSYSIEPAFAAVMMVIMSGLYPLAFYLTTRRTFKNSPVDHKSLVEKGKVYPRKRLRIISCIVSAIVAVSFISAAYIQFPDIEYLALKQRYDAIDFGEEILGNDYYESMLLLDRQPFKENNGLAILPTVPTLQFKDLETMPKLDGATAFYPMYASFVQNVYANEDTSKILEKITCTKTDKAYSRLADGQADMIFAFEPSQSQLGYAASTGIEYEMTLIGYDAFCFFVNVKNPVNGLTLKQVQDIYHGDINNWRKVGGKNARILAFTRPENSGSQTIMKSEVMQGLTINSRYNAFEVVTMGGMIKVIDSYLNTSNAIGYTFMYYSSQMVKGDSIKYLAIDGIAPTSQAVRAGQYAFIAPFYAITRKGQETTQTKQLLEWITGKEGQSLIAEVGYVSANA